MLFFSGVVTIDAQVRPLVPIYAHIGGIQLHFTESFARLR